MISKICENCGTNKTYVRPTGKEEWKKTETGYLCKKCFMKNYNRINYVSNPRDIPHGPCVECKSETTYVRANGREEWKKVETGAEYLCKSCASRELESKKWIPKDRTPRTGPCVECDSETTYVEQSGYAKWYNGPNGIICKRCWNNFRDKVMLPGLCVRCNTAYTHHGWTETEKGTICNKCQKQVYGKIKRGGLCGICEITKATSWRKHKKHGRICSSCYSAIEIKEIKKETLSHYSNGKIKCETCGYNKNINALQLDHIKGGGNVSRKKMGNGGWAYYKKLKKAGYPEGYQVLCANCNVIKKEEVDPKGI